MIQVEDEVEMSNNHRTGKGREKRNSTRSDTFIDNVQVKLKIQVRTIVNVKFNSPQIDNFGRRIKTNYILNPLLNDTI